MFTINIYLKFAIIFLCLVGGIVLSFVLGIGYTWIFIIIGLLFLASYLLLGTVQSASEMLQKMDFEGAENRLNLTYFPKLLYVTNRAFYYILKGSLAAQKKDNNAAELYFNQALALDLPSDNEKGMVLLQMSGIQAQKIIGQEQKIIFIKPKNLRSLSPSLKNNLSSLKPQSKTVVK
ncbi:MAG: hypothetical protein IPJ39_17235 [Saprospiraceae bacterium]|nr:hypothetical protein [Saprospiraceae bacterium]